jgi:hypothetical protein
MVPSPLCAIPGEREQLCGTSFHIAADFEDLHRPQDELIKAVRPSAVATGTPAAFCGLSSRPMDAPGEAFFCSQWGSTL